MKRPLDVALVLMLWPIWFPIAMVVGLVVRVTMGSPVLFSQDRAGLHGRVFRLVKFRTMLELRSSGGKPLADADRLTPAGRWLRASSLDELPGLFNVLAGQVSLVGPRPLHVRYLPRYSAIHARRHEVRPGVTGLAQVRGRNSLTWTEKFDLDIEYVDRCSFSFDMRILLQTLNAVVLRKGTSPAGAPTEPEFLGYDSVDAPVTASQHVAIE